MKHERYDMIAAKNENTSVVVFMQDTSGAWETATFNALVSPCANNFFLCLPQHKEAVLCGLNGGGFEVKGFVDYSGGWWLDASEWRSNGVWYMREDHHSRKRLPSNRN